MRSQCLRSLWSFCCLQVLKHLSFSLSRSWSLFVSLFSQEHTDLSLSPYQLSPSLSLSLHLPAPLPVFLSLPLIFFILQAPMRLSLSISSRFFSLSLPLFSLLFPLSVHVYAYFFLHPSLLFTPFCSWEDTAWPIGTYHNVVVLNSLRLDSSSVSCIQMNMQCASKMMDSYCSAPEMMLFVVDVGWADHKYHKCLSETVVEVHKSQKLHQSMQSFMLKCDTYPFGKEKIWLLRWQNDCWH